MTFWILVAAIAGLLFGFPYIRFFIKRCLFRHRVKKLCRAKNWTITHRSRVSFLSGFRGPYFDLFIETAEIVYAVKLGGAVHRRNEYWFRNSTQYAVKNMRFLIGIGGAQNVRYEEKAMPHYAAGGKLHRDKHAVPILLLNPMPGRCLYGNPPKLLTNGTQLGELKIYSSGGLLKMLYENDSL